MKLTIFSVLTTCVFFLAGWRRGPVDFDLLQRVAQKKQARWGMFISLTVKLGNLHYEGLRFKDSIKVA